MLVFSRDDFAFQVHARGKNDRFRGDHFAHGRLYARNFAVFHEYFRRFALQNGKVFCVFEHLLHARVVCVLVRLRAQALHRRALARIQHADLERGLVGVDAHFSPERVYLAHEVPLRRAADGRIARHKRDAVEVERQHQSLYARAGECEGGFRARVPRAYDHGVVFGCVKSICDHNVFEICPEGRKVQSHKSRNMLSGICAK